MNAADFAYLGLFLAALLAASVPLGRWLADVLMGRVPFVLCWLAPVERATYRLSASILPPRWAGASTPERCWPSISSASAQSSRCSFFKASCR
jgi:hypothetical protein